VVTLLTIIGGVVVVSVDNIPPKVGALAVERQLGRLLASRGATSRRSDSVGWVLAAFGALGVGVLLAWWGGSTGTRSMAVGSLTFFCAFFPALLGWGIRLFLRGSQAYYVYEGGLVYDKSGRPRLVRWPEVAQLTRRRAGEKAAEAARSIYQMENASADMVLGYDVRPVRGGKLTIHVGGVNDPGYAAFCGYLEQLATQGGARITG
jgi:hypothetical protein